MAGPKNQGNVSPETVWKAITALYLTPGVEAGMLDLQDRYGANILVMLYLAWLMQSGFAPKNEVTLQDILTTGRWRRRLVLGPVRRLRRTLFREKGAKNALKTRLLAAELQQEQALLEALIARTTPLDISAKGQKNSIPMIRQYMIFLGIDAPYKGTANLVEYFSNIFRAAGLNR